MRECHTPPKYHPTRGISTCTPIASLPPPRKANWAERHFRYCIGGSACPVEKEEIHLQNKGWAERTTLPLRPMFQCAVPVLCSAWPKHRQLQGRAPHLLLIPHCWHGEKGRMCRHTHHATCHNSQRHAVAQGWAVWQQQTARKGCGGAVAQRCLCVVAWQNDLSLSSTSMMPQMHDTIAMCCLPASLSLQCINVQQCPCRRPFGPFGRAGGAAANTAGRVCVCKLCHCLLCCFSSHHNGELFENGNTLPGKFVPGS